MLICTLELIKPLSFISIRWKTFCLLDIFIFIMRVLLTGGSGYIGSHVALLLLEKGYDVLILDSFVNRSSKVIQRIKKYLDNNDKEYKLNIIKNN